MEQGLQGRTQGRSAQDDARLMDQAGVSHGIWGLHGLWSRSVHLHSLPFYRFSHRSSPLPTPGLLLLTSHNNVYITGVLR